MFAIVSVCRLGTKLFLKGSLFSVQLFDICWYSNDELVEYFGSQGNSCQQKKHLVEHDTIARKSQGSRIDSGGKLHDIARDDLIKSSGVEKCNTTSAVLKNQNLLGHSRKRVEVVSSPVMKDRENKPVPDSKSFWAKNMPIILRIICCIYIIRVIYSH